MIVAVLSDIHSNLVALDAVLESAGAVDAIWQLGDVVGYGPWPDEVVGRLRDVGAIGVRGNHDDAACGRSSVESFNPVARRAAEWTRQRIAPATRHYLLGLPERLVPADSSFTLAHGSPRDPIFEYVFSTAAAEANMAAFATPYCLVGHTHVPLVFRMGPTGMRILDPGPGATLRLDERRAIVNPGSVGQPRDGDPDASYLILDTTERTLTWHRVRYDVGAVQAAIRAAGLPAQLAGRLAIGQ